MGIKQISVLVLLLITTVVQGADVNTDIPSQALRYKASIDNERDKFLPNFFEPAYFPALIEHESCISLTHSKCWNPAARLKTSREEGIGLGQLTRAYNSNGRLRFDKLEEVKSTYKTHLRELAWGNIRERPDLQIRVITLMTMENWNQLEFIKDPFERLAMTDSAYNGGMSHLKKDRLLCGLTKGCDPNRWFGHVEGTSVKSRAALYAGRSPYQINRHHVRDVLKVRVPKYQEQWYPPTLEEPFDLSIMPWDEAEGCPIDYSIRCVKNTD